MPNIMKPDKNDKIKQMGQTTGIYGEDPYVKAVPDVTENPPEVRPT